MWLKSKEWVHQPHYAHEIRREMRVRESKHTAMLFDRKYYDSDTGKYVTDKLPTLYHSSISDIIDDSIHNNMSYGRFPTIFIEEEKPSNVYDFPKFIPKDNDFDLEVKREKELKQQQIREKELQEQRQYYQKQIDESRRIREEREQREQAKRERWERESKLLRDKQLEIEKERLRLEEEKAVEFYKSNKNNIFKSSGQYIITASGKRRIS